MEQANSIVDFSLGTLGFVLAPMIPVMGESVFMEWDNAFTLIIQFLSAVLLGQRILKNNSKKKNDESS
jgi:hypothetical protein